MNEKIKRIIGGLIDFYIIVFSSSILTAIFTLGKLDVTPLSMTVYFGSYIVFLGFRDAVFKNASVGKRIFKLEVIKNDETELRAIDIAKRNIPLVFLLPVEIFLMLFNDKRIGDIWAKTSVVCMV